MLKYDDKRLSMAVDAAASMEASGSETVNGKAGVVRELRQD